jgi:lipopolysaccharide export system permease protein
MKYIDHIAGKGLSWFVIVEFVGLSLAWIIVLAVPMSVLVSTLMAFGGLSSTNEITIIKASGISLYRIIIPVLLVSSFLTFFLIWFNNDVLPDSNHRWASLYRDIQRKKPTLTIEAGIFNKNIEGYCILVRKTFEHSNELENITIFDYSTPNKNNIISAQKGDISFSLDYEKIIINLIDGEIHELITTDFKQYRTIKFKQHKISIPANQFGFQRSTQGAFTRSDREMSSDEMRELINNMELENQQMKNRVYELAIAQTNSFLNGAFIDTVIKIDNYSHSIYDKALLASRLNYSDFFSNNLRIEANYRKINQYLVEIYKKYSIPVACLIFVLLGASLGIMTKKGGFGIGASLSLGFFLLYWSCLMGGEKLADRGFVSPFIGMWIANIILGILGIYLVTKVVRESPGLSFNFLTMFLPKRFKKENN